MAVDNFVSSQSCDWKYLYLVCVFAGALVAWIPRDVQKAKAFMQHNLAVAHATRTEYDKANKYLTEVRSGSLNW